MLANYDFKILFYLIFILIFCLLPVYLFRKRWKEVGVVAAIIIYFFILNKDFIWGSLGVYHDTRSHEYLLTIFKQWMDAGIPIGWNPYMNGGEPLYLFSNGFLWAQWVLFCWIDKLVNVGPHTLFNLFWIFHFINFCIGCLLLFMLLYENFRVTLFCFISLVLSGKFIVNLGQTAGFAMYYLPYILFSFILFYKRKNIYGFVFTALFSSLALNHYLPHYIFLGSGVFIFFMVIFNLKLLPSRLHFLRSKFIIVVFALTVSLVVSSPALFSAKEIQQQYVSPTRGALSLGVGIKIGQTGSQPNVNAPLWGYRVLLEQEIPYRMNIHHAFYFGIIPLLLIPAALTRWRDKYVWVILASTVVILFLSTGDDFWGYRLLIKYVPGFNMMRHSVILAQFVSFFLICLSGYGFRELLREDLDRTANLKLKLLTFATFVIMFLISQKSNVILFGSLGALILILLGNKKQVSSGKIKNYLVKQFYIFYIFLLFVDLTLFYVYHYERGLLKKQPVALSNIVYPLGRTFYPLFSYPLPPDLSPLIFKKASLTHHNDDLIFFRNQRLHDMLKLLVPQREHEQALGVNVPIIYFTQNVKILSEDISKEQFIKTVYEDALKYPFTKDRNIFFSKKDIDFYDVNNHPKNLQEATIEYTKIDNPNILEITADTPSDGFLVRLENFHPGWKAFIDGSKASIYRANYAFQAIRVLKGKHKVVLRFVSIYPFLFYLHIVCVFLNWVAFNFSLFKIGKD